MPIQLQKYWPVLRAEARKAVRRHRLDQDDTLQTACLIFFVARRQWRARHGPFEAFLRTRLRRLADAKRRAARRARLLRCVADVMLDDLPGRPWRPTVGMLGPDAAAVARLAITSRAMEPRVARGALRRYFSTIWSPTRYRQAVAEILEVLE